MRQYDGDLDDYRELLFAQRRTSNGAAAAKTSEGRHTAAGRKEQRRAAAEERVQNAQLKRQAQQTERRLADLNKKKAAMQTLLADLEIDNGPTSKLLELQLRYGDIKKEIAAAEDAWLVAQAALESVPPSAAGRGGGGRIHAIDPMPSENCHWMNRLAVPRNGWTRGAGHDEAA